MDPVDLFVEHWMQEDNDRAGVLARSVVARIFYLSKVLEARANRVLDKHGLSLSGYDVLEALKRTGPLTPSQIMRKSLLTSGAVTNRVDRLEQAGLVERKPSADDRRSQRIVLTRKGQDTVQQALPDKFVMAKTALAGMSEDDMETLANGLSKLLSFLMQQEDTPAEAATSK